MLGRLMVWAAATCVVAATSVTTSADVIIFDDTYQNGFSGHWSNQIVGSSVLTPYEGSTSVRRETGTTGNGPIFEFVGGVSYGENNILSFWANSTTTGAIGMSQVRLTLMDNSIIELGVRASGVTWMVDGVPQSGHVSWTNDPQVWTHVTFDLSQTYWRWDGSAEVPAQFPSDTLFRQLEVRYSGPAGPVMFYMDDVRLIPEPASLALLGLGGLLALGRRRKHEDALL